MYIYIYVYECISLLDTFSAFSSYPTNYHYQEGFLVNSCCGWKGFDVHPGPHQTVGIFRFLCCFWSWQIFQRNGRYFGLLVVGIALPSTGSMPDISWARRARGENGPCNTSLLHHSEGTDVCKVLGAGLWVHHEIIQVRCAIPFSIGKSAGSIGIPWLVAMIPSKSGRSYHNFYNQQACFWSHMVT